jgi:hypothetical protein
MSDHFSQLSHFIFLDKLSPLSSIPASQWPEFQQQQQPRQQQGSSPTFQKSPVELISHVSVLCSSCPLFGKKLQWCPQQVMKLSTVLLTPLLPLSLSQRLLLGTRQLQDQEMNGQEITQFDCSQQNQDRGLNLTPLKALECLQQQLPLDSPGTTQGSSTRAHFNCNIKEVLDFCSQGPSHLTITHAPAQQRMRKSCSELSLLLEGHDFENGLIKTWVSLPLDTFTIIIPMLDATCLLNCVQVCQGWNQAIWLVSSTMLTPTVPVPSLPAKNEVLEESHRPQKEKCTYGPNSVAKQRRFFESGTYEFDRTQLRHYPKPT